MWPLLKNCQEQRENIIMWGRVEHQPQIGLGDKPNELTTNRNKKSDGILLIHIGLYIQITLNIYNLFINK